MTEALVRKEVADLPVAIARLVDDDLPEILVRTALADEFKSAPVEKVAKALAVCKTYKLNPLAGHIALFQPRKDEPWTWMVTVEGRLEIATRHPDFAGIEFGHLDSDGVFRVGGPRRELDEWHAAVMVHRHSWKVPFGPIEGRCKATGRRSQAKGGGTYDIEWAQEIARSRAVRNALRMAFGLQMPDDFVVIADDALPSEDPSAAPMRPDQRRTLFAYAHALKWSDEERRARAGVNSFTELTEQRAAQLIAEWEPLVERATALDDAEIIEPAGEEPAGRPAPPQPAFDPETGELRDVPEQSGSAQVSSDASDPPRVVQADAPSTPSSSREPVRDELPNDREVAAAVTDAAAEAVADIASAPPPQPAKKLRAMLVAIADEYEWSEEDRIASFGSIDALDAPALRELVQRYAGGLQAWRRNRQSRLAARCAGLGKNVEELLQGRELESLKANEAQALIDSLPDPSLQTSIDAATEEQDSPGQNAVADLDSSNQPPSPVDDTAARLDDAWERTVAIEHLNEVGPRARGNRRAYDKWVREECEALGVADLRSASLAQLHALTEKLTGQATL